MDKSTQLTLFDCARKRHKTSCATDSETINNVVVDLDSESELQVSNTADLEQIELEMETQAQESHDVIDCTMHGSPLVLHSTDSSPDVISESEISDEQMNEAAAIQPNEPTTDISCSTSNAALVLQNTQPTHTQHKPCSEPIDIAPGPAFSPVQPVGIKLPKYFW